MGTKPKRGNSWNPQSNAILEQIQQVLSDGLRVYNLENIDIDEDDDDPFDEYLAAVSYGIRSLYHQTHGHSPAQLVFGRDMSINSQPEIDWEAIRKRKQEQIRVNNERENKNHINHTYKKGDRILVKKPGIICKLSLPYAGPYKVVKHCRNGSITYENLWMYSKL